MVSNYGLIVVKTTCYDHFYNVFYKLKLGIYGLPIGILSSILFNFHIIVGPTKIVENDANYTIVPPTCCIL